MSIILKKLEFFLISFLFIIIFFFLNKTCYLDKANNNIH